MNKTGRVLCFVCDDSKQQMTDRLDAFAMGYAFGCLGVLARKWPKLCGPCRARILEILNANQVTPH